MARKRPSRGGLLQCVVLRSDCAWRLAVPVVYCLGQGLWRSRVASTANPNLGIVTTLFVTLASMRLYLLESALRWSGPKALFGRCPPALSMGSFTLGPMSLGRSAGAAVAYVLFII